MQVKNTIVSGSKWSCKDNCINGSGSSCNYCNRFKKTKIYKLLKALVEKIDIQEDEDYWQEITVDGVYYDCNIFERSEFDQNYCKNSDPNDLMVEVYNVVEDKHNPGFMTTDTSKSLFIFYMSSEDKQITTSFNKTLVIKNVNFKQLEKQRLALIDLEAILPDSYGLQALQGVIEMLDAWSDKEYYKSINHKEV